MGTRIGCISSGTWRSSTDARASDPQHSIRESQMPSDARQTETCKLYFSILVVALPPIKRVPGHISVRRFAGNVQIGLLPSVSAALRSLLYQGCCKGYFRTL